MRVSKVYLSKGLDLLIWSVFLFLFCTSLINAGSFGSGYATERTQLANNIELLANVYNTYENLQENIEQLDRMDINLEDLPEYFRQQILDDLTELAELVAEGQAIAYSSAQIDSEYRRVHRDYEDFVEMERGDQGQRDHDTYEAMYQNWSESNHDSIRNALRAAGLQSRNFAREELAIRSIEDQIANGVGMRQLLKAGGAVSVIQVEHLMKLRQLVMAQMQSQTAFAANQINKTNQDLADYQRAVRNTSEYDAERPGGLRNDMSIYDER